MWICPKCKESMRDCDEKCWSCGSENPSVKAPDSPAAPAQTSPAAQDAKAAVPVRPMKKCPFCAEEIRLEARKCRFCGSALPEASAKAGMTLKLPSSPETPKGESPILKAVPVIIAIIVFIGLIAGIFAVIATTKPVFRSFEPKIRAVMKTSAGSAERAVAYEEVTEYDARGKVVKTTRNYAPTK